MRKRTRTPAVRRLASAFRIGPRRRANGERVVEFLRAGPPDEDWEADVRSARAVVEPQGRDRSA